MSTVFAEESPYLKMLPSEYIKSGRVYFNVECGEKTIPDGVRWGLEHTVLYSSDYPHWDGDWPHTIKTVRERQDLSDDPSARCSTTMSRTFTSSRMIHELRD